MSKPPYTGPEILSSAFNCPFCHAYSNQYWKLFRGWSDIPSANNSIKVVPEEHQSFTVSTCPHCDEILLWHSGTKSIIFPDVSSAPPVNSDVGPDVTDAYNEAASIASKSPRGAAALLRLAIQHLCIQLKQPGKNIATDIAALVKQGLPSQVQQALDIVRVIGNEAVHPGTIDLRDNPETVSLLFSLVNTIAEKMISEPKEIERLYGTLPETKLEAIKKRDKPKKSE